MRFILSVDINRQGPYSKEGSIVVLCAYLGQLSKVRLALSSEVTVVIDERDEVALAEQGQEQEMDETLIEQVQVSKRVGLQLYSVYIPMGGLTGRGSFVGEGTLR